MDRTKCGAGVPRRPADLFISIATDPGQSPGTKMRLARFISRMELCEQVQRTGFFFTRESAVSFRLTAILSHCIAQFTARLTCHLSRFLETSSSFQRVRAAAPSRS